MGAQPLDKNSNNGRKPQLEYYITADGLGFRNETLIFVNSDKEENNNNRRVNIFILCKPLENMKNASLKRRLCLFFKSL